MWGWIVIFAGWVWDALQAAADYAIIALTYAYKFLKAGLGDVWGAAKWSYNSILKPIGNFLHAAYDRVKAVYDRFVQPAINWLHKVSNLLRKLYVTFVQPILSAIDGVQRLLQLLELFHIQWAKDLDDALERLEEKISRPLQLAIQFINSIVSRIEKYILTADNLFQRLTHMRTIQRDLNSITNMHLGGLIKTLDPHLVKDGVGPIGLSSVDDDREYFRKIYDELDGTIATDGVGGTTTFRELYL
jgi:hypothetical protein